MAGGAHHLLVLGLLATCLAVSNRNLRAQHSIQAGEPVPDLKNEEVYIDWFFYFIFIFRFVVVFRFFACFVVLVLLRQLGSSRLFFF